MYNERTVSGWTEECSALLIIIASKKGFRVIQEYVWAKSIVWKWAFNRTTQNYMKNLISKQILPNISMMAYMIYIQKSKLSNILFHEF